MSRPGTTADGWPLAAAVAGLTLLAGILLLHLVHEFGGHRAIGSYGLPIAVVIVVAGVSLLPPGRPC